MQVAFCVGRGTALNLASVITPSVPSEWAKRKVQSTGEPFSICLKISKTLYPDEFLGTFGKRVSIAFLCNQTRSEILFHGWFPGSISEVHKLVPSANTTCKS